MEVIWEVSNSPGFHEIINSGSFTTSSERDYTVKVDVDGLQAGTAYYYRFKYGQSVSITGKTKTLTTRSIDSLKFAIVSCANYEFGFFNTYEKIADRQDLDAVLHLGDYIYEYGPGTYGDTVRFDRRNFPEHELITLEDYRYRYSQYRLDEDLRKVHQNHPFITIWDDHEIANNSYKTGAQNHQEETEGPYDQRSLAAKKAYYEWLPVREGKMYRSFKFGDFAKVIMLEERLEGRTAIPESLDDTLRTSPDHTILGEAQMNWLKNELNDTTVTWKLIGNQVIFSYLNWGWPNFTINLDAWDGYPGDRTTLSSYISENQIQNIVFATGDTHSSWAFEVTGDPFDQYDPETGEGAIAVEFGTTSINSANSDERTSTDTVLAHEQRIMAPDMNPHLKYANLRDHGYLLITLYPDNARAQWYYINDLTSQSSAEILGAEFVVRKGETKLMSGLE